MKFGQFRMLTFDTYGTLIDWEAGILAALGPLMAAAPARPDAEAALEAFGRAELALQAEQPGLLYSALLAETHRRMAAEWGAPSDEARALAFGRSVKDWPAFADAPEALAALRRRFRMATLTNCDRISYMGSNARLEIEWDAIYTAQDVGAYKPSPRNFEFLLQRVRAVFGVLPHEVLHVAQSLTHDMVPATAAGLSKVWIDRRHDREGFGATAAPSGAYTVEQRFDSMAAFAQAVRAEFGD